MAVNMKLLKGPNLQRIVVLVLLSLAGLGYPPDFCEAIRCYNCTGDHCTGQEGDCDEELTACSVSSGGPLSGKDCDDGYLKVGKEKFGCIQKIVGGSGSCINGYGEDLDKALCQCGIYRPDLEVCKGAKASGRQRRETKGQAARNSWTVVSGRSGPEPTVGPVKACTCTTDLCNTDDFLAENSVTGNGGKGNGGKGNGAGPTGRNMGTTSGVMVTLSLLATKGLLY